jgi:hypothetical protein
MLARTVDVEHEHRECRPIRLGLAPRAPQRRPLERSGDFGGAAGEHARVEIERVAGVRHVLRPSLRHAMP